VSVTLAIVKDNSEASSTALLAPLQKRMDSATNAMPATLAATRLCLEKLVEAASGVVGVQAEPESTAQFWVQAFTRQCQDLLDELTCSPPGF
jgi:hypothetical protein